MTSLQVHSAGRDNGQITKDQLIIIGRCRVVVESF